MKDNGAPRHEENGASRLICYLLSAFSMGLCFYLLIVIQR